MLKTLSVGIFAASVVVTQAHAGTSPVLANGTYQLLNHPDGNEQPPLYGLRLDGLFVDSSEEFTFDFNNELSDMQMTVTDTSIVIDGVSWGGRDIGTEYAVEATTGLYTIHFEYLIGVGTSGDAIIVDGANNANIGYIIAPGTTEEIALEDERGGNSYSFQLNTDHRGFAGVSGWGWLNHSDEPHVYASDWLFTVGAQVPTPGTAVLAGFGGLVAMRRRR